MFFSTQCLEPGENALLQHLAVYKICRSTRFLPICALKISLMRTEIVVKVRGKSARIIKAITMEPSRRLSRMPMLVAIIAATPRKDARINSSSVQKPNAVSLLAFRNPKIPALSTTVSACGENASNPSTTRSCHRRDVQRRLVKRGAGLLILLQDWKLIQQMTRTSDGALNELLGKQ